MKIKRNDPCPCGSGRKYKKCCMHLGGEDNLRGDTPHIRLPVEPLLSKEDIRKMSTEAIINKLKAMNIPFDEEIFQKDIQKYYSAEDLSENWFDIYNVKAVGREEDFPWLGAFVLWERLAPQNYLSLEQIDDLYLDANRKFYQSKFEAGCDKLLLAWEGIKKRFNPMFRNLDFTEEKYISVFSVRELCLDLEENLHYASIHNNHYAKKRMDFCMEFCKYFPNEKEDMIIAMKKAIAESHHILGDLEQANNQFDKIIAQFPNRLAGYIGIGDILRKNNRYEEALNWYEKGLTKMIIPIEKEILLDRIIWMKEIVD